MNEESEGVRHIGFFFVFTTFDGGFALRQEYFITTEYEGISEEYDFFLKTTYISGKCSLIAVIS